jgi:hypothetical protein
VSAVELVTGVVSAFFAIGVAVGVISVIALGAIRGRRQGADRAPDRRAHAGVDAGHGDEKDDGPPRWPGRLGGLSARGG